MNVEAIPFPGLVVVPEGSFSMGENDADKFANDTERPRHEVLIRQAFHMGKFPVTVGEFRSFRPGFAPDDPEDWPAVGVSWTDADAYCKWLARETVVPFRLPSEAEWEYACRTGSRSPFTFGTKIKTSQANYLYTENGRKVGPGRRTPCGVHPPNALGLYDMHGNVCEWVADPWHPSYHGAPANGGVWTKGARHGLRVIRGGAWDYLPRLLRSSWRDALPEATRRDNLGFRLACDL